MWTTIYTHRVLVLLVSQQEHFQQDAHRIHLIGFTASCNMVKSAAMDCAGIHESRKASEVKYRRVRTGAGGAPHHPQH